MSKLITSFENIFIETTLDSDGRWRTRVKNHPFTQILAEYTNVEQAISGHAHLIESHVWEFYRQPAGFLDMGP